MILLHPCSVSVLILHLIGLQPVWPSHGWPRQVHQHMPSIYLHSSKSHSSGLPGSACTASPGSCPTSLKTTAQRCSGPGSRGPSALQSSALAAAAHRHTTPPVKAQHQVQHLRRVRSKGILQAAQGWSRQGEEGTPQGLTLEGDTDVIGASFLHMEPGCSV